MVDRCRIPVAAVVGMVVAVAAAAVRPANAQAQPAPLAAKSYRDPYQAYAAGEYQQALEKLTELQIARPEDPDLMLNVGSAHYQLEDYSAAEEMYRQAAQLVDPARRATALFNLGNTAYRQGRLTDAIDHYMAALDLDPQDEDAKFNLEFVREEIRRRQQQQEQQQQQQDQQNPGDQQNQDGQGNDANAQQPESGTGDDADQDQDGLPDEVERMGRNPTDPTNPDTDGDGTKDGEEDRNHNGQVDPGETDPNVADNDDTQDARDQEDAESQSPDDQAAEAADRNGGSQAASGTREMTREEAARLLQALEEKRPENPKSKAKARSLRVEKDW